MSILQELVVPLDFDVSKYVDGITKASQHTDSFVEKVAKIGGATFLAGIGAATAAVGGLVAGLVDCAKGASDAADIQAQLNAVLESTGGAAGMTADAVNDLATELSKVTRYEDDTIVEGENMLLTFTNIGKNVFPKATKAMLNLSTAMKQDLKSSAIQLGKALNDPVKGITALTRVGVTFTEEQKAMVEQLVAAGKVEEAQGMILQELEKEFGGSAEAAGKTFAGQLDILKNKIGNVKDSIGAALMPALQTAVSGFNKILESKPVQDFLDGVVKTVGDLSQAFSVGAEDGDILNGILNTLYATNQPLLVGLADAINGIRLGLEGSTTAGTDLQNSGIANFFNEWTLKLQDAWTWLSTKFWPDLVSFANEIKGPLGQTLNDLGAIWNTIWTNLVKVYDSLTGQADPAMKETGNKTAPNLTQALTDLNKKLEDFNRWLNQLSPETWKLIGAIIVFAITVGPTITLIERLIKVGTLLSVVFTSGAAEGGIFAGVIAALGGPIGILIGAILALVVVIVFFGKQASETAYQIIMIMEMLAYKLVNNVFGGIERAINWVISRFRELQNTINSLHLPSWLTPGSPTPLELGIRGIGQAMQDVSSTSLPSFSQEIDMEGNLNSTSQAFDYEKFADIVALRQRDTFMKLMASV